MSRTAKPTVTRAPRARKPKPPAVQQPPARQPVVRASFGSSAWEKRLVLAFALVFVAGAVAAERIYEQGKRITALVASNERLERSERDLDAQARDFIRNDCAYQDRNRAKSRAFFGRIATLDEAAARAGGPHRQSWAGLAKLFRDRERELYGNACSKQHR